MFYEPMRVTSQMRVPETMRAESIGERLRLIREAAGLKPAEMAELLGVERTYWTRWEKGHRPVPNDICWQLTERFDVDLDYILAGSTKSVPAEMQAKLRTAANKPLAS